MSHSLYIFSAGFAFTKETDICLFFRIFFFSSFFFFHHFFFIFFILVCPVKKERDTERTMFLLFFINEVNGLSTILFFTSSLLAETEREREREAFNLNLL